MRLAIDARKLAEPTVGIGQYLYALIKHLPLLASDLEIFLLTNSRLRSGCVPDRCREVILSIPGTRSSIFGKLMSPLWLNSVVPRFLKRAKVDLFHGANFVIPVRSICPSVSTVHDLAFMKAPEAYGVAYRNYIRLQVRSAVSEARHFICVSNAAKNDLVGVLGVSEKRVSVIHHGVADEYRPIEDNAQLEEVRGKLGVPARFALHVGVVQRRKNIETLIAAAAPLIRDGILDGVVLAGQEGFGAERVREAAAVAGIRGRVFFLGHVPQVSMAALYGLAAVVVMPSWYEGFGMPVLEAMACGTPVVASSTSSLPEVVGDAALTVFPDDTAGLRQSICRLLADSTLYATMRRRGLERARLFSWTEAASHHLQVYRAALNVGSR